MQLSDLSVRRPVFAAVIAVLLCIVGVVGYISLSVREYPDTDPPIVSVETTYTGAAASVVETRITQILEDSVAGVQGIRNITSASRDGTSTIVAASLPPRSRVAAATMQNPPRFFASSHPARSSLSSRPAHGRHSLSSFAWFTHSDTPE